MIHLVEKKCSRTKTLENFEEPLKLSTCRPCEELQLNLEKKNMYRITEPVDFNENLQFANENLSHKPDKNVILYIFSLPSECGIIY
ncbi:unnamed protein product, partial [Brenthis ino]